MKFTIVCRDCSRLTTDQSLYHCPHCGGTLDFELEIASRAEELKAVLMNAHAFWDYAPFFPVLAESKVTMGEGNTALIAAQRLQEKLGVRRLFLKNETANPLDRLGSLHESIIHQGTGARGSRWPWDPRATQEPLCCLRLVPRCRVSFLYRVDTLGAWL